MPRSIAVVAAVLCSCGVAQVEVNEAPEEAQARQKEEWSASDSPLLFSPDLELSWSALPKSGEAAHVPWPGSYWPVSADVINFRWAGPGSDSPAKKYERAFNGAKVEDAVSRAHGIDSATGQRSCTSDRQCDAARGEVCGVRSGRASGRCVPTWWGICHAWTPASILFPEPRSAVVRNGVRFEVPDLKALASLVHDRTRTRFVALRCNIAAASVAFDRYGRPTSADCRDTNAGTYHVLLANYLGRLRQSFAEDRTLADEVWNQPLRSFRVVSSREVTADEANRLTGAGGSTYAFAPNARRWVDVQTEVRFISESDPAEGYVGGRVDAYTRSDQYEYVLELDAAGKIIGGEWVGQSKASHPDFLWLPLGPGADAVAGGAIRYEVVKQLVLESAGAAGGGAAATQSATFTLPRAGWRFLGPFSTAAGPIAVELAGSGDADSFVRLGAQASAALYDCRPWLATSNESCALRGPGPLYVAVHADAPATVTVRVRYTAGPNTPRLSASGRVEAGELKTFAVSVTAGRAVTVRTTAAGDVDVFVRLAGTVSTSRYDASAETVSGDELVRIVPRASGTLSIGVLGYEASAFTLTATEEAP